ALLANESAASAALATDWLAPSDLADEGAADMFRDPVRVGRFRVGRRIGEGGMGVVYEAEQDSPRRTIALKLIRAGCMPADRVGGFGLESEVLGQVQHPGIGAIHDAGVAEIESGDGRIAADQPYFAMELVQGLPLLEYCDRHQLGVRARLELMSRI